MSAQLLFNENAKRDQQTIQPPNGGTFPFYLDGHFWTKLTADTTPTVALSATEQAALKLYTDTTDENEVAIYSPLIYKFQSSLPLMMTTSFQFTELTSDGANVAFGFCDLSALTNTMQDAGAGPSASITSGVMIYKADGDALWTCWAKNNGTTKSTESLTVPGGSSYNVFTIGSNVTDGQIASIDFYFLCNGIPMVDDQGRKIQIRMPYASGALMRAFLYGKTGTSGEALTINTKYVYPAQTRV